MSLGTGQILLILVVVLIIFGFGKLPQVMKDLAKGLKVFKEELHSEEDSSSLKKKSHSSTPSVKTSKKTLTRSKKTNV